MTISPSQPPEPAEPKPSTSPYSIFLAKFGKRIGLLAFFFFLAKGLAWLVVPTAIVWAASR